MPTDLRVVPAAYIYFLRGLETGHGVGRIGPSTEVLLQLRQNTGFRDGFWAAGSAGHLDQGETPAAAAAREGAEELGVDDIVLEPLCAMARTGSGDPLDERVDYFFTATSWSGEPTIREPRKCAELRWCRLDALPDPTVPHEAYVLGLLAQGAVPPVLHHGFA